jgi:hypothetical protein
MGGLSFLGLLLCIIQFLRAGSLIRSFLVPEQTRVVLLQFLHVMMYGFLMVCYQVQTLPMAPVQLNVHMSSLIS